MITVMKKLKLSCDRRSVGQSVLVSGSHLELMTGFFFSVWRLWVSWCWAPSLTRGWACNLLVQFLLGLATVITLGSKSRRTHHHMLLSHLRLLQHGSQSRSRSRSYFTTDGQSWCRAPLWGPWPDFTFSFLLPENCFALRLQKPSLTIGQVCNL
jgi:hypothetical protein